MTNFSLMTVYDNQFVIRALVAPCYSKPSFASSKTTEAVYGETVRVINTKNDWLFIQQEDGYESWVKDFYGTFEKISFKSQFMVIEKNPFPFGSRLVYKNNKYITVNNEEYKFKKKPARLSPEVRHIETLLNNARSLIGCPYRWGGKTSLGFDCSGFVQTVYLSVGLTLPRDSWQQSDYFINQKIDGNISQPGDLHFFGKRGKISHVGISTGGLNLIHCQGWVKEESFSGSEININYKLSDMYMHTCSVELNLNT